MRKRLCIFVVDDDTDLGKSTGTLLKTLGHDSHVFDSAEAAVGALDTTTPDLILSDVGMPGMDGCELARQVKQKPNCEKVVLVAVTGFAEEEHRRQAIEAGFDYRFVKPLAPVDLREFLNQLA
jgi:CheY-like chemotaxis protein